MTSPMVLTIASSLLDFLFKSSLCFVAALVLVRLILSPRLRFAVWFTYLVGSMVYASALAIPILHAVIDSLSGSRDALSVSAPITAVLPDPVSSYGLWTLPAAFAPCAAVLLIVAAIGYLLALAAKLSLYLRRQSRLRRALLFAYAPPTALDTLFQSLSDDLGLPATTLLVLPGLNSPATIGWWHPIVLLPPACEDQPLDQSADILRHELHHILRRDWLLERIACASHALLFFQPALSAALRHLRIERELACDQAVVNACPDSRLHYAESLLEVARLARQIAHGQPESSERHPLELASGIEFVAGASHLETRLRAVLAMPHHYPRGLRSLIVLTAFVLVIMVCAGLPYLTVTLAFTNALNTPHALSSAASTPRPGSSALPAAPERQTTASRILMPPRPATQSASKHPAMASTVASSRSSSFAAIPAAPTILIASRPETSTRTSFKLEPAADTEDLLPAFTSPTSSAAHVRSGPLSTSTNPAIQASSPTHNIITVLADAAVLLSRRDTDHDDH